MRGSDFKHWLNWVKNNHSELNMSYDEAKQLYDSHYACNCVSCVYRKEHGFVPLPTNRQDCYCPPSPPKLPVAV